jgi:membrane peptidoglycan carboxypeptidase
MDLRRGRAIFMEMRLVVALFLLVLTPAAASPRLEPDPALQARVASLLSRTPGTAIVYDMAADRVLAVSDPAVAFRTIRPPGSVMKLVTATLLYPTSRRVRCTNHLDVAGRDFTCAVEGGHGVMGLRDAIARSCSIFFYTVGQRIAPARLLAAARRLGLGGASPEPGGARSRLWMPATRRAATLALVGEGDAIRITPWDAVVLVHRLHDARDPAGRFVYSAMRDVVTRGTGQAAALPGVEVHGKTGTADGGGGRTHGWFVCAAGRLVVVVYLEEGSGHDAARLAGRVLRACEGRL